MVQINASHEAYLEVDLVDVGGVSVTYHCIGFIFIFT